MRLTAGEVAERLDGTVVGDSSVVLTGFAPASFAKIGDLTFAENPSYFARAEESAATAVLVDRDFESSSKVLIRVPNARVAYAKTLPLFIPEHQPDAGVHPTAVVAANAQIDPTAHVGPYCVIGDGVVIGPGSALISHVHVGAGSRLGGQVRIFPNVVLYENTVIGERVRIHSGTVIGSDGFGYVQDGGKHLKVPQIGNVVIQDDVEIGANVTIDGGALGPTLIGAGTKIDNLVQIAHNVVIGENCLLVAQAGIAGSTRLGQYVTLAGQVGLAGHLKIGNQVTVAAQSGVMHNIGDGQKWFGSPAKPDRQMKRQLIAIQQLPKVARKLAELEKEVARLRKLAVDDLSGSSKAD